MNLRRLASRALLRGAEVIADVSIFIDKGEEDVFEVAIIGREPIRAKVASEVATAYIVAQRVGFASWEPLYGEKKDTGERVELPSCFSLRDDAVVALERAIAP